MKYAEEEGNHSLPWRGGCRGICAGAKSLIDSAKPAANSKPGRAQTPGELEIRAAAYRNLSRCTPSPATAHARARSGRAAADDWTALLVRTSAGQCGCLQLAMTFPNSPMWRRWLGNIEAGCGSSADGAAGPPQSQSVAMRRQNLNAPTSTAILSDAA